MSKASLADLLQKVLDARASTSSEDEAGVSIPGAWKKFRDLTLETHPDVSLPERPRSVFQMAAFAGDFVTEQFKLPLFPGLVSSLETCEESIKLSPPGQGLTPQPLKVGSFFKPPKGFPNKYWEAADGVAFNSASSRPQNVPVELFPDSPGDGAKVASMTDRELKDSEKVSRELVSLWSLYRWSMSSMRALMDVEDVDELKSHMQVVLNQQDLMAPFMEQRLLLQFSNTMLKRRDFFLASKEVQKLKPTTIQQMRASPLVGPELLSLPQELIDEETDIKSTKSFLHQLVVGQKKWYMNA